MSTELSSFAASIQRWDLNQHPFYQAWAAGTLPTEALATYARDWGAFVRVIDRGWESAGMPEYAAEEREHAQLWDAFAGAVGTAAVDAPEIGELAALRSSAERLFSTPATALGALYAFEAQQPTTSASKLEGLKQHYSFSPDAETYFAVHANDESEAQWLAEKLTGLAPGQREVAADACEHMCRAMWEALSGIYSGDCAMA